MVESETNRMGIPALQCWAFQSNLAGIFVYHDAISWRHNVCMSTAAIPMRERTAKQVVWTMRKDWEVCRARIVCLSEEMVQLRPQGLKD